MDWKNIRSDRVGMGIGTLSTRLYFVYVLPVFVTSHHDSPRLFAMML